MPRDISTLTLAEALKAARSIFAQGPVGNPRAVVQAYNSFQARWAIVQKRKFNQPIQADVLAVILVLQYAWPALYKQISNYPEMFFYLHALATWSPNSFCTYTEIQEIFDLGLPSTSMPSPLSEGLRDPDLIRLLQALSACPWGVEHLVSHLTLTDDPAKTGVHLIAPNALLLSGDPALIKFGIRTYGWEKELFLLINALTNLKQDTSGKDLRRAINIIFTLGRLPDDRALQALILLASSIPQLPIAVTLRLIYALGHRALDGRELAFSELLKLLERPDLTDEMRTRAVQVLRHCKLSEEHLIQQTACELNLLSQDGLTQTSGWLRLNVKENLLARPEQALCAMINPQKFSPKDVLDLCAAATEKSETWPWRIARHLIAWAKQADPVGDRAFELIKGIADRAARVRWLIWVALTTHRPRPDCLRLAGKAQAAQQVPPDESKSIPTEPTPWQSRAWRLLIKRLVDEKQEELLIAALGETNHTEAIQMLKGLYKAIPEIRIREQIRQVLEKFKESGVAGASTALDELDATE